MMKKYIGTILILLFVPVVFTACNISLLEIIHNEPEIETKNITGMDRVDIVEDKNIYMELQGHITGTSQVNIESSSGDVFLRFKDQIAGNAQVNIRAVKGDIYLWFDEITGNAKVHITSERGDVTFIGERSLIEEHINRNNITVKADGRIFYESESLIRDINILN